MYFYTFLFYFVKNFRPSEFLKSDTPYLYEIPKIRIFALLFNLLF